MPCSCILMHMRTTLDIDEGLLREARKLTGLTEKTAIVRAGLEALIARESGARLAALGASQPGLRPVPRRRPAGRRRKRPQTPRSGWTTARGLGDRRLAAVARRLGIQATP